MKPEMLPETSELWRFLWMGYLFAVVVETPVLLVGLSRRHRWGSRLVAGIWLNACSFPFVALVFPHLIWAPLGRTAYVVVAEVFAPVAECLLFWLVVGSREDFLRRRMYRDFAALLVANLASFLLGEWWF